MIVRILASVFMICGLVMCCTGFTGLPTQYLGLGFVIVSSAIYVSYEIRIMRETLRDVILLNRSSPAPASSTRHDGPLRRESAPSRPLPPPTIVDLDAQDAAMAAHMRSTT